MFGWFRAAIVRAFALESLAEFGRRDFDGDVAAETGVASFVDLAHPARTDACVDLVGTEPLTGAEWHTVEMLLAPAVAAVLRYRPRRRVRSG